MFAGMLPTGNVADRSRRVVEHGEWSGSHTPRPSKHTFGGYAEALGGIDIYMPLCRCLVLWFGERCGWLIVWSDIYICVYLFG